MNEQDKKRFGEIRKRLAIEYGFLWHGNVSWLCSRVKELDAELAEAKEGERVQASITKQRMQNNHHLSARLAKVKGQRDRIGASLQNILPYAQFGPPERTSCTHTQVDCCDMLCVAECGWDSDICEAQKALAELEKEKP